MDPDKTDYSPGVSSHLVHGTEETGVADRNSYVAPTYWWQVHKDSAENQIHLN